LSTLLSLEEVQVVVLVLAVEAVLVGFAPEQD
jgi:hypothetical protein